MKIRLQRAILVLFFVQLLLSPMLPMAGLGEDIIVIEDYSREDSVAEEVLIIEEESACDEAPEVEAPPEEVDQLVLTQAPASTPGPVAGDAAESAPQTDPEPADGAVGNGVPAKITLGVGEKYTLNAKALASGKKITYKSRKASVASVTSKGVVKGKKKGSTTIQCYAGGRRIASCKVKVVGKPKSVSLDAKKMTIGVGESVKLTPTIPDGTHASFTWSSSSGKVASVSKKGVIKGKKKGTTTITVQTHNGRTAKLKLTVAKAPESVSLSRKSVSLNPGASIQLKAKLLPCKSASYAITWTSSDKSVATVSKSGKVKAVGVGSATITVSTFNGCTQSCTVVVSAPTPTPTPGEDSVKYRALLIGEANFVSYCWRNRGDVALMENMLNSVRGLYGGRFSITKAYDLSRDQTLNAIASAFAGANENDVSLFFIATHGDTESEGSEAGQLAMIPSGYLQMKDLANALLAVPGKVIVILESCGSGAPIYDEDDDRLAALKANTEAFGEAAARAFSSADPGVVVELKPSDLDSNGIRTNTGELRVENKFYVLTASAYQQESYGYEYGESGSYNLFTKWLTEGVDTSGKMPADADGNGKLTLQELYAYISSVGDNTPIYTSYFDFSYQHVQVYPAKSGFVLFVR